MRKLLNTLFVINEDAYLTLDGENLVVTRNKQETHRYALHFSRVISLPFSCMSQFGCSSVMPVILFFTSSRFMVETPFCG